MLRMLGRIVLRTFGPGLGQGTRAVRVADEAGNHQRGRLLSATYVDERASISVARIAPCIIEVLPAPWPSTRAVSNGRALRTRCRPRVSPSQGARAARSSTPSGYAEAANPGWRPEYPIRPVRARISPRVLCYPPHRGKRCARPEAAAREGGSPRRQLRNASKLRLLKAS
jgi:hypothetical protein